MRWGAVSESTLLYYPYCNEPIRTLSNSSSCLGAVAQMVQLPRYSRHFVLLATRFLLSVFPHSRLVAREGPKIGWSFASVYLGLVPVLLPPPLLAMSSSPKGTLRKYIPCVCLIKAGSFNQHANFFIGTS